MPLVCQDSQAALARGRDYLSHGLTHAAILEFTKAFVLDRMNLSPLVDRLEALTCIGHHDDCLADTLELLNTHGASKVRDKKRTTTSSSKKKAALEVALAADPADESPCLSEDLLERLYVVLTTNIIETHGLSLSYPPTIANPAQTPPPFDLFLDMKSPHRSQLMRHIICTLLDNTNSTTGARLAAKSAAFLARYATICNILFQTARVCFKMCCMHVFCYYVCRFTAQGSRNCKLLVAEGAIPVIIHSLVWTQTYFDSTLSAQQQTAFLPLLLPLWCDAVGVLVNITRHAGGASVITASDGLAVLVKLARRAMPHARVACAALQAIGNLTVLAEDAKAWADITAVGTKEAFVSALSIPIEDLIDLPVSAKEAEQKAKGQGVKWQERRDRLELLVVSVLTLGRVLQVAQGSLGQWGPGGLARDLAISSAVSCLQCLFRYEYWRLFVLHVLLCICLSWFTTQLISSLVDLVTELCKVFGPFPILI